MLAPLNSPAIRTQAILVSVGLALSCLLAASAVAQSPTPAATPSPTAVFCVNQDVFTFVKYTVIAAGIFLGALAFIGLAFFGFDVRKAQSTIQSAKRDINAQVKEAELILLEAHRASTEIKEKFDKSVRTAEEQIEKLGAEIEAYADKEPAKQPSAVSGQRDETELLKEIIRNSTFHWSTIKRLVNKTGLSRDRILEIARGDRDFVISVGKKTGDHIFTLRGAIKNDD
jgi:F0F1-type ATP synthase membrane subunit b/b'